MIPIIANVVPPTYPDEEIMGGDETDDFPDCCAVGNATKGYMCSGTLIAPNVVVTANHCTDISQVFLKGNNVDVPRDGEMIPVVKSCCERFPSRFRSARTGSGPRFNR